jgi:predicted RNase H-like nuclease (RuvC/YqgF family)
VSAADSACSASRPQLGTQIFQLEEEADEKDRELEDLRRELEAVDKEVSSGQRSRKDVPSQKRAPV